jgi:hypothetical protein
VKDKVKIFCFLFFLFKVSSYLCAPILILLFYKVVFGRSLGGCGLKSQADTGNRYR